MLDFFHELMRVSLIFFVVIVLVVLAFMIAPKLKLTLPLTCFVLFCTLLSPWAGAHEALAFKIIYLLIGQAGIRWIITLVLFIKDRMDDHRLDRGLEADLYWQLQKAEERNVPLKDLYMDDDGTLRNTTDHKPLI
ncbi:hypothetical protein [Eubacterium sp. 1001713B170207_170306_E7]|uniref:hypothetical protein n=1 Tax=Eubacterium sp. 1001713B170207_170306_E7 TaxID=2787097 RepID=UPI001896BD3A|nr:hypothetical protein [Eubacterium sp. 1001713B170207_170306_E7]